MILIYDCECLLSDCVVSHNNALVGSSSGGGIVNLGGLQATRVTFSDNHVGGYGGGIANVTPGNVTLSQSTLSANSAGVNGGGISDSSNDAFTLDMSTVAGNMAGTNGGGIYIDGTYALIMTGSTVSGNNATDGGGVYNGGGLDVVNSTISGNSAAQDGGGYYNASPSSGNFYNATIVFNHANPGGGLGGGHGGGAFVDSNPGSFLNVRDTVLAGNTVTVSAFPDDCYGTVGFFEKNQVGTSSAVFTQQAQRARARCWARLDQNSTFLAIDQRGRPRPPPSPSGNTCYLGAFEYNEIFHSGFELIL